MKFAERLVSAAAWFSGTLACCVLFMVLPFAGLYPPMMTYIVWLSSSFLQLAFLPILAYANRQADLQHAAERAANEARRQADHEALMDMHELLQKFVAATHSAVIDSLNGH